MNHRIISAVAAILVAGPLCVAHQDTMPQVDSLADVALAYHEQYQFSLAMEACDSALVLCGDSLETSGILRIRCCSETALRLMDVVSDVKVVARQCFSVDDFYLYYPLPDNSWRMVGGALPMYYPEDADTLRITTADTLKRAYTVREGDRLFFASDSLGGVGGYDLFYSEWDRDSLRWGEPVNMGYPFNSPGDDILFVDTPDGQYSIFASNRDCSLDSVYVYVLEAWEPGGHRKSEDSDEIMILSRLDPSLDLKNADTSSATGKTLEEDEKLELYRLKTDEMRDILVQLSRFNGSEEEKSELTARLHAAKAALEEIEMYFLSNGTEMDLEQTKAELEHEVADSDGAYVFTKKTMGRNLVVLYE